MQTKYLCVLIHIWIKGEVGAVKPVYDLSIDEMVGAWYFGCLSGPLGLTCWISYAQVFSFIYCWVLIFALSPCYTLILYVLGDDALIS